MYICTYWFGQATLVHVIVACAPLPASTGVVDGPGGAGHTVAVVAGVGRVVASVGMVVVLVVAVVEEQRHSKSSKRNCLHSHPLLLVEKNSIIQDVAQSALPSAGRITCADT